MSWARQVIIHVSLSSNTVARGHKEARAEETADPAPGVCKVAPLWGWLKYIWRTFRQD